MDLKAAAIIALRAVAEAAASVGEYYRERPATRYQLHEDELIEGDTATEVVAALNARRREHWEAGEREWVAVFLTPEQRGDGRWSAVISRVVESDVRTEE